MAQPCIVMRVRPWLLTKWWALDSSSFFFSKLGLSSFMTTDHLTFHFLFLLPYKILGHGKNLYNTRLESFVDVSAYVHASLSHKRLRSYATSLVIWFLSSTHGLVWSIQGQRDGISKVLLFLKWVQRPEHSLCFRILKLSFHDVFPGFFLKINFFKNIDLNAWHHHFNLTLSL